MFTLDFSQIWTGSLEGDLEKEVINIKKRIPTALQRVGADMIYSLERHINDDVYNAYTPYGDNPYVRRLDNDFPNSLLGQAVDLVPAVKGTTLTLTYNPNGDQFQTERPVHGDDLIRRIETGVGYMWAHKPPARPFWRKFVDEQIQSGIVLSFIAGMSPEYTVTEDADGVTADGSEYVSEWNTYQSNSFDISARTGVYDTDLF